MKLKTSELIDANGGYWGEHPDHPVCDWLAEVDSNDTREGYWEWVAARIDWGSP